MNPKLGVCPSGETRIANSLPIPPWIGEAVEDPAEWMADVEAGFDPNASPSRDSVACVLAQAQTWPAHVNEDVFLLRYGCRVKWRPRSRSFYFEAVGREERQMRMRRLTRYVASTLWLNLAGRRALAALAARWKVTESTLLRTLAADGLRRALRSDSSRRQLRRFGRRNEEIVPDELRYPLFPAFIYLVLNDARNPVREYLDAWATDGVDEVRRQPKSPDAGERAVVSLDDPLQGDAQTNDGATLHDVVADDTRTPPDAPESSLEETLEIALAGLALTPAQRRCIAAYGRPREEGETRISAADRNAMARFRGTKECATVHERLHALRQALQISQ